VQKKRPVNLNLFTIQFPLPAITSILHRISGFALFLFIPFLLWMLHASLASPEQFTNLHELLTSIPAKLGLILLFAGLFYHLFAGIRHLFMDAQIGETLKGANRGAVLVLILSTVFTVMAGYWLW
jgi:succinate dehydrogenase / fumarate reductase cytochrome b subunit